MIESFPNTSPQVGTTAFCAILSAFTFVPHHRDCAYKKKDEKHRALAVCSSSLKRTELVTSSQDYIGIRLLVKPIFCLPDAATDSMAPVGSALPTVSPTR
jgi:hypothetical protein